jgi:uncharacterized protein YkwD
MPTLADLPPWMTSVNAVDCLLVGIVLLGAWGGWRRGCVAGALQLLALGISVVIAFVAYEPAAAWLRPYLREYQEWAVPAAFLLVFGVAYVLLGAFARALIRATPAAVHRHAVNHALGVLPGGVNGLIAATVAAVLLLTMPPFDAFSSITRESALAARLAEPAEWVESQLEPVFEAPIRRALHQLLVPADAKAFVELPFKASDARERPDLEAKMLELLNAERAKHGLKPLRADPELTQVARAHSRDMFARGYFSHSTPDHVDPFDRMRQAHLRFLTAGENLALAPDVPQAHEGLMNSPGHRANILRPQFGRVGIGVLDGGQHGLMVTQNFRN